MRDILITTETGSDMPDAIAEKLGVSIVPMHVILDGEDLPDCSFPIQRIYDYYNTTKKVPTTSATNIGEYLDFFNELRRIHPNSIILHFAYSSGASSTYQNVINAVEELEDIYIIDTKSVTAGCIAHIASCWPIIEARKHEIADFAAFAAELETLAGKVHCSFVPGNLDYLKAGGRVSNAAYLGATLLKIKPMIELDEEGRLVVSKKYRGTLLNFADTYVREYIEKHDLDLETLFLMHTPGTDPAILEKMRDTAIRCGYREVVNITTGCVITCHAGPGAVGLAGVSR